MSFAIAMMGAFIYITIGFSTAFLMKSEDDDVALFVFLWPLVLLVIILFGSYYVANGICKRIYKLIKRLLNGSNEKK